MDTYITSVPPEEIVCDISAGKHKFYGIGPALAWEYIRNVGIDGLKLNINICRFLSASRMGESNLEQASPSEAVDIVRRIRA